MTDVVLDPALWESLEAGSGTVLARLIAT